MPERDKGTILDRFTNSQENLKDLHDQWDSWYRMYRTDVDEDDLPTRSHLHIPVVFSIVETLMPRLVSAITGSDPMISTSPVGADDVEAAKIVEALHEFQLRRRQFEQKLIPAIRDAIIYGVGAMKVMFADEFEDINGQRIRKYRGPDPQYINPFDVFPDPHAKSVDDAMYVIHRYYVSKEELLNWEQIGIVGTGAGGRSIDKNVTGGKFSEEHADDKNQSGKFRRPKSVGDNTKMDDTQERVQVIEYWEDDWVTYVANQDVVIRNEPNPFQHARKPFVFFNDYPVGDSIFGHGEIENIEDLQHEINTKRNQRIDAVNISMHPPVLKSPFAGYLDDEEMVIEPYAVWTARPEEVGVLNLGDFTAPGVREEQLARQDARQATAISQVIQGLSSQNNPNTATGFNTLNQNAANRFNLKIRNFEAPIQRLANMMYAINFQFMSGEQVIRITDETDEIEEMDLKEKGKYKFLEFTPDDIAGQMDFVPRGARSVTMRQRQQRMLQLIQAIGPIADQVNIQEVFRELAESMGIKDVGRFLDVPDEQIERMARARDRGGQEDGAPAGSPSPGSATPRSPANNGDEESAQLGPLRGS